MGSEHAERYTQVYVSDQGAATIIQDRERTFPVGSMIVKEKLINADDTTPVALGIMIKREAGFNPAGDDWEYAYWEQAGGVTRGTAQLEHCQACHIQEAAMDSVFWP
jgi:alpha-glucuronidase